MAVRKPISNSPDRLTFLDKSGRYATEGGIDDVSEERREIYERLRREKMGMEADPTWAEDNMEYDLRTTDWILEKVRGSNTYSQNLYAALCNNDFVRRDVYNVLIDKRWHCSWRHAGGIVADMRGEGDYIEWYMSGMDVLGDGQREGYVSEGHVTDEIRGDLWRLGWGMIE